MKQYGSLRKSEIRKFIKSEVAKADRLIEVNDRFSIFYVKRFNQYVIISNRTRLLLAMLTATDSNLSNLLDD